MIKNFICNFFIMLNYLVKILIVILFSFFIAFFYYSVFPWKNGFMHSMNFDWYTGFIIPLIIFYAIYKFLKTNENKEKVEFSLYWIFWYFLLILLLLCLFFFWINDFTNLTWTWKYWIWEWFTLFFKIVLYLIIPTIITFLNISFGRKISKYFWLLRQEPEEWIYNFLISLWLWFFLFLFLLTIIWLIWIYNIFWVFIILLIFLVSSLEEIWELWQKFINYRISFENHNLQDESLIKNFALKLLSTEFLFILASIIISVNLINIVRPMPIWWDDLWVYMNYPRQMAFSGKIDFLTWMYVWQIFTGIWFMLFEPVQAFFLNNIWWILSFIVIILVVYELLKDKENKTKTLINIPLLLAVLFISMPMVVFQQAKDMKLDEWLFFVSVIVLYLVFKNFVKSEAKNNFLEKIFWLKSKNLELNLDNNNFLTDKKLNFKILFVIWILAWFAFSIKFTSLLLISAIIWVLFYVELWFLGFLGYLWLYFALFTKAWLWHYLNVIYPENNIEFINYFSLVSLIFWIDFLVLWYLRHKNNILKLFKNIWIFILWIIIALLPWFAKNIYQIKISDSKITIWTLINGHQKKFNPDFTKIYSKKELEEIKKQRIAQSKLSNSWTTSNEDMWRYLGYEKWINNYVKLPWNLTMQLNQGWEFTTIWWLFLALIPVLFLFLSYRKKGLEYVNLIFIAWELLIFFWYFNDKFSKINFPEGYIYLFLLAIIPVIFLLFALKNTKLNNLFKLNLIFTFFYIFLFVISAYWIVWYWILMYFSLLLMIGISLYELSKISKDYSEKQKDIRLFWSFVIFWIFLMYFFLSVFPYVFTNLKQAWYPHFKAGQISAVDAVFAYHPEYKKILFNLNIDKTKLANYRKNISLKDILKPNKQIENEEKIYRIWTFLKYFINWNDHRLLEDNLVNLFDTYFYWKEKNSDLAIERMKKIWLKYLLVDLNAATIDNDPRHDLTRRYEELLKSFSSNKLELIDTDSICLKLALDLYKKSQKTQKDLDEFMILAWVNFESYPSENKIILRKTKQTYCLAKIKDLAKKWKINKNNYPYLLNFNKLTPWYKVLFEIK